MCVLGSRQWHLTTVMASLCALGSGMHALAKAKAEAKAKPKAKAMFDDFVTGLNTPWQ